MKRIKLAPGQCILHGECIITVRVGSIPAEATKLDLTGKPYIIVAPSETTGNHHVVEVGGYKDSYGDNVAVLDNAPAPSFMEAFTLNDNTFIMTTSAAPVVMKCLHPERHDAVEIEVPAGTCLEFGSQQEFDPFTARLQKVRD